MTLTCACRTAFFWYLLTKYTCGTWHSPSSTSTCFLRTYSVIPVCTRYVVPGIWLFGKTKTKKNNYEYST